MYVLNSLITARMIIVRYSSTYFVKVLFSSSKQQFSDKLRSQPIAELENEITIESKSKTTKSVACFSLLWGVGRGGFQQTYPKL